MKKTLFFSAIGIITLIIIGYLFVNPFIYERNYFSKIGIKGSHLYDNIILWKGKPIKIVENKDNFIAYYNGLNLVFVKEKGVLIRAEIVGKQYHFGLRSIGVDSTRKQVESAYKNVKKIKDPEKNEFGVIDNDVWVDFIFDSNDKVEKILIYFGP